MDVSPPISRSARLLAASSLATVLLACGGGGGGEDLDRVFRLLSEPSASPAQVTRAFVQVLDAESRARVEAHAAALSSELGVAVGADDVLMLGGIAPSLRVNEVTVEADTVHVALGRIDPAGDTGALMPEPIVWRVRQEGGRARLVLPAGVLRAPTDGGAP